MSHRSRLFALGMIGLSVWMGGRSVMAAEESSEVTAYKHACKSGDAVACFELGYLYENGMGMKPDTKEALKYYKKSCEQKYQFACEATVRVQKRQH